MRILFISSWAANNGLSRSTVHPHLLRLATYEDVERILYISIEPTRCSLYKEDSGKVEHAPILKTRQSDGLVSRIVDQIKIRKACLDRASRLRPDFIICRGAQAAALGYTIWKKYAFPYFVESFEPHAEYMVESKVWSRFGIKCLIQRFWERRIKETATRLITVSEGYAKWLEENEQIPVGRLRTVPCWVNEEVFNFDEKSRELIRAEITASDSLVCVYLGQFGGLYYDIEAFEALSILKNAIDRPVQFLLLTPGDQASIEFALEKQGILQSEYSVLYVDHAEIPGYLSAADFAVSFHRSTPMAYSFSPIKYGEYWSCGLPVIAPESVGDDSTWIDQEGLGCVVDFLDENSIKRAANKIVGIVNAPGYREEIRAKGSLKRSKEKLITVYDEIISEYRNGYGQ